MPTRRDVLLAGGAALGAAAFPGILRLRPRQAPLRILILGGTGFIGPHLVRYAVSRGHSVSTFTRGRHKADLPAGVEKLIGDRNGQLDALRGRTWDAVIDDSATNPDWVRQTTELLHGSVGRYLFTSSTGVYYPYLKRGYDEHDAPHLEMKNPKDPSEKYGVSKAQCEAQVHKVFGDHGAVVRPTFIIGPGDTTDRFPYWPVRLAKGGDVLAPGKPDDPVAFIDVRNLVMFMVKLLEEEKSGIYNVVGPRTPMTARQFYERARKAVNPSVRYVYVDDYDFLAAHKVFYAIPWILLRGNDYGEQSVLNDKAIAAGLTFRPIEQTLADTLSWWPTVPEARRAKPQWSIPAEVERKALADWAARPG